MIVHKFGGTSLGTAERISSVAEIIASGQRSAATVAVVSAIRGTTDHLISGARAAAAGQHAIYREIGCEIARTHHGIVDELLSPPSERTTIHELIDERLEQLERIFDSIAVLGEVTARGQDAVACFGEHLSAIIFAAVLRHRGIDAQSVSAIDLIVTDDAYGSASPLMAPTSERIRKRIRPLVDHGIVPVVTGYIGATETGIPTTLGRSGSDFSAAIIAAGLDSGELRIWTDVDGILTADPNVVPAARVLRHLSYEEATRLARFGAEVLHPRTIGPVIEHRIPLYIQNSFNPSDPGTRIVKDPSADRHLWPAIVSATGLRLIRLRGSRGAWQMHSATEALSRLNRAGIAVRMFSQSFSEEGLNLVVGEHDGEHSVRLLSRTGASFGDSSSACYKLDTIENVATVSVIGWPSSNGDGIASRAFAALGKHQVRVVAVTQAATEDSVTFCLPDSRVARTLRLLHEELGLGNGKETRDAHKR